MYVLGRLTAAFCACLVVAFAGTVAAASYTDKANGDYDDPGTWNEGGNPGGGGVADTVTIDSHEVTMTVAGDGSNDTITVKNGGMLRGSNVTRLFEGAEILLDGGILWLRWGGGGGYWDGYVRVVSDSTIQTRGNNIDVTTIRSLELTDGVTLTVDHNDQRLGVAGLLSMSGNATIDVLRTGLSNPMEVASISGTGTLTKVGTSEDLIFAAAATDFSGGLVVGEGYVYLDAANALQGSKPIWISSNATLQSRAGYALNGCTVNVDAGGTIKFSRTTDALAGSTSILHGATAWLDGGAGGSDPGGDIRVLGTCTALIHGGNINLMEIDGLELTEGAHFYVVQDDQKLGVADTLRVSGNSTISIIKAGLSGAAQIGSQYSVAASTLRREGDEKMTLNGNMGIRLLGDADLIPTNSFITITNAGAQITDNTTWEDSTMWTKGGSAATAITATLNPAADNGTIDNAHGSVSFASSNLGYVTVTGLRSGGGANARLVIVEFDSPSDLDGIQSKLEAAHPDWTKFFQKGSNKIGFTLVPAIDGTGYFGWDNKHGELGANVLSIWFGPPDRGTVIQIL